MIQRFSVALLVMLSFSTIRAQGHVAIDTVHLGGLDLNTRAADIGVFAGCRIDTMLWGGEAGASMFGFKWSYLGEPGEVRVATENGLVSQLTFVAATKDSVQAASRYRKLSAKMEKQYGDPDEEYANRYRFETWHGKRAQLSVKTMDGANYLTVTLSAKQVRKASGGAGH